MSIETIIQHEARLIILKELAIQQGQSITSEAMRRYLLTEFIIDKPREWVEAEFRWLRDVKAVELVQARSVLIARISERGQLHLDGTIVIPGIQRPSPDGV